MKILAADQIRQLDQFTIAHEAIASIDLMERAALACTQRILHLTGQSEQFYVVCGAGNNGGDGLAITRQLLDAGRTAIALVIADIENLGQDARSNFERLKESHAANVHVISNADALRPFSPRENTTIVDAIFGTGLNRPVEGLAADAIAWINAHFKNVISIDVPSGLYVDASSDANKHIVRSSLTLTFQFPKLCLLLADNKAFAPNFEVVDIGLHPEGITQASTNNYYVVPSFVSTLLRKRNKFSHKGDHGHALLIAGSTGMGGAALIAAAACMRSGVGWLTVHSTAQTLQAMRIRLPEAMTSTDQSEDRITETPRLDSFSAIGFGPGTGTHGDTARVLKKLLQYHQGPLVIDADGLNILAENKTWLDFLPAETILTPHPGEFARLAGKTADGFERLDALRKFSVRYKALVILKGAHSAIAMPDGNVFFNSSGNPGLAKAGSGDALTGILLGLLARGYRPPHAALIGTYVHGFAADLVLPQCSSESMLATDVIAMLPQAFRELGAK